MLCTNKCLRKIDCKPISNVVSHDESSFVCIGYHNEKKDFPNDVFRHCFKSSADTDSMYDYDEYDLKSVINVMSEALLVNEINKINNE